MEATASACASTDGHFAAPLMLACDEVCWAHAVNSRDKAAAALADKFVNFLEADVIAQRAADGTVPGAVMGHNPGEGSDYSFAEFLRDVRGRGKGLKVDIKEWDAVPDVLAQLQATAAEIDAVSQEGAGCRCAPAPWRRTNYVQSFGLAVCASPSSCRATWLRGRCSASNAGGRSSASRV